MIEWSCLYLVVVVKKMRQNKKMTVMEFVRVVVLKEVGVNLS